MHNGATLNEISLNHTMRTRFNGIRTNEAEKEHYTFLNEMRQRLGVDS
jgi:hypothetical protein